jgi:hypothetical protein
MSLVVSFDLFASSSSSFLAAYASFIALSSFLTQDNLFSNSMIWTWNKNWISNMHDTRIFKMIWITKWVESPSSYVGHENNPPTTYRHGTMSRWRPAVRRQGRLLKRCTEEAEVRSSSLLERRSEAQPEQRGKARQLTRKSKDFGEEYRWCRGIFIVLETINKHYYEQAL